MIFFPHFFSLGGGCGPVSGCYIITVVAPWAGLENTNNFVFSSLIVLSEQFRTIWFQGHWVFNQCPYHTGDSNWLGRSALVYYLLFLSHVTGVDDHVEGGRSAFVITTCRGDTSPTLHVAGGRGAVSLIRVLHSILFVILPAVTSSCN